MLSFVVITMIAVRPVIGGVLAVTRHVARWGADVNPGDQVPEVEFSIRAQRASTGASVRGLRKGLVNSAA